MFQVLLPGGHQMVGNFDERSAKNGRHFNLAGKNLVHSGNGFYHHVTVYKEVENTFHAAVFRVFQSNDNSYNFV